MGNIAPRAGIEPTYLAFRASVIALPHLGSLCRHYVHVYLAMQLIASEVSADYYTYMYIYMYTYIYTYISIITYIYMHSICL